MGAYFMVGRCFGCKRPFSFNPHRVPSVVVDGVREPVCEACVAIANPQRERNGLEPIRVLPGAYDVVDEDERHF